MIPSNTCCIACHGHKLTWFGTRRGYDYYRCVNCGTLQLAPMPDIDALRRAYAEEYARADHWQRGPARRNEAVRRQSQAIVDTLLRHGVRGMVLDVGAGWGDLLDLMREHDIACEGVEPSREMQEHCASQGHRVHHCLLEHLDAHSQYDALTFSSVFEHLITHDASIDAAHRLLKPGGLLISLQPTALFPIFVATVIRLGMRRLPLPQLHHVLYPPWHTVLFSISGMTQLLSRHGFVPRSVHIAPQQRDMGWTLLAQRILERINHIGWRVAGTRWPLAVGHLFVFQKAEDYPPGAAAGLNQEEPRDDSG